jgi:glutamyl-Q tRNA(Asp) synthetase
VGSYLDAHAQGGEWLLRLEDVDLGRVVPGAADDILRALEAHGLGWDGPVLAQSTRGPVYESYLARLVAQGRAYPCSRADYAPLAARDGHYPGTCRRGPQDPAAPLAMRLRTDGYPVICIEDRLQGSYCQSVEAMVGDFVLRRRDGYWSYQLAVVVDDAEQGITDVVRGMDLLDNTPRQALLQAILGLPMPTWLHLPLLVDDDGAKLSKSRQALPVAAAEAPATLSQVLALLRHPPPAELVGAPVAEQLAWAVGAWQPERLAGVRQILVPR